MRVVSLVGAILLLAAPALAAEPVDMSQAEQWKKAMLEQLSGPHVNDRKSCRQPDH
jgi:hypothetical protein